MEKRPYCDTCKYPRASCVCDVLLQNDQHKICSKSRITILQDVKELKSAKNTVRLIPLCFGNVDIFVGDSKGDFEKAKYILEKSKSDGWRVLLVYPNEVSKAITDWFEGLNTSVSRSADENTQANRIHLVLIDATWRRAYRLWKLNAWLSLFQSVHFVNVKSIYRIRKIKNENYLSTIEALVYGLNIIEPQLNTDVAIKVFEKMQSHFFQYKNS